MVVGFRRDTGVPYANVDRVRVCFREGGGLVGVGAIADHGVQIHFSIIFNADPIFNGGRRQQFTASNTIFILYKMIALEHIDVVTISQELHCGFALCFVFNGVNGREPAEAVDEILMTTIDVAFVPIQHRYPIGITVGGKKHMGHIFIVKHFIGELIGHTGGNFSNIAALCPHAAVQLLIKTIKGAGIQVVAVLFQIGGDEQHINNLGAAIVQTGALFKTNNLTGLNQVSISRMLFEQRFVNQGACAIFSCGNYLVVECFVWLGFALIGFLRGRYPRCIQNSSILT